MFIVRLYDSFDGWIDVSGPLSEEDVEVLFNKHTKNGTRNTCYAHGDYYVIFPADTRMIVTTEFLGR